MKTAAIGLFVVLGLLAFPAVSFAAFDFADSFQTGPGQVGSTINFAGGGSFNPAGIAQVSGALAVNTAVLDVIWNTPVDAENPGGGPDLILWFGSISANSTFILTSVGISEDGNTFLTESLGASITDAFSGGKYTISLDDGVIPPADRDDMVVARFTFNYASSTTFEIDGVSTPEPATIALVGLGLSAIGFAAVRRRRQAAARQG